MTQLKQLHVLIMRIFPKDGPFVLSLKQNIEHLPTILKQCAIMLNAILTEHVSTHAMMHNHNCECVGGANYNCAAKLLQRMQNEI